MYGNYSIRSLLILTFAFAALLASPRLIGEIAVPHWTLLWIATLHQIALATAVSTFIWLALGKRRLVSLFCAVTVLFLWGPNLVAATEMAIYGNATMTMRFADAIGVRSFLNDFYTWTYDAIGYKMMVASPS